MVRAAVEGQTILQPRYRWSGVSCDITAQWYCRVDHSIHVLHELISLAINQRRNCVKCKISDVYVDYSCSLLMKLTIWMPERSAWWIYFLTQHLQVIVHFVLSSFIHSLAGIFPSILKLNPWNLQHVPSWRETHKKQKKYCICQCFIFQFKIDGIVCF